MSTLESLQVTVEAKNCPFPSQPEVSVSHGSHSDTLTPPNSPGVKALPLGQIKTLIQTAIDEAKRLPCSLSIWEEAFGPNPREPLISILERALVGISGLNGKSADESIETAKQDVLNAPHGELCGLQRLADILEKRIGALPTPPPSDSSECGDEEKSDKDKRNTQQALKLKYKLVDETYVGSYRCDKMLELTAYSWDEKEGRYKIVESAGSELDKLEELLFVVRERTGLPPFPRPINYRL
jgi:hypothetical protein